MKEDPRFVFILLAIHHISERGDGLEVNELIGLKMIMENIVIDGRDDNEQTR